MSVINTNTLSLVTQNNLTKSQASLNSAVERLSSGMRINSAKDDAAGQAIANRFTANIKGLSQAQRNANDGISMAQTTEGALNEVNTNLQRIRELAVQAANGSNSIADKASIQAEITQRMQEIDRTSAQTDFNGTKVLSATAKIMSIQVGAQDGQTISIGLKEISTNTLKLQGFNVSGVQGTPTAATAQNLKDAYGATTAYATASVAAEATAGTLGTRMGLTTGTNAVLGTGVFADASGNFFAKVTVTAANAADVAALKEKGFDAVATVAKDFYIALNPKDATASTASNAQFTIDTTAATGIKLSDVASGATPNALKTIDDALKQIDDLRGSLGAVQNRFDSVIANLGTTIVNMSASRSRIEDADYAVEVSNMTRAQILQQAGTSVLAKANQSTEGVMALLR